MCHSYHLGVNQALPDLNRAVRPRPARDNLVSRMAMFLRRRRWGNCVFDSWLLDACCYGANWWYWVWYYLGLGRRYREKALRDPNYGRQWWG